MLVEILMGILGMVTMLAIFLGSLPILLPYWGSLGYFVNKAGATMSGVHFFTKLQPGQIKLIVRGEKPIRMITNTSGKRFTRTGERDSAEFWELIDGATENPVADVWPPIRGWAQKVYDTTGLVFTGIYPFQRVYEYKLTRTKITLKEPAERKPGGSNIVLTVVEDYSDHFRTREFLYPMHITAAETADKIGLDILGIAEMFVSNAYRAAFGTDRWDHKVLGLVSDAITSVTKALNLDQALTAQSGGGQTVTEGDRRRIQKSVEGIEEDTKICGVDITGFKILEINPALDADRLKAIQAEAIAIQQAKATRVDGEARAEVLKKINAANEAGGSHAVASMEAEAFVRAAEAAGKGGGTVILMPGGNKSGGNDSVQAAILAELVRMNTNAAGGRKEKGK